MSKLTPMQQARREFRREQRKSARAILCRNGIRHNPDTVSCILSDFFNIRRKVKN